MFICGLVVLKFLCSIFSMWRLLIGWMLVLIVLVIVWMIVVLIGLVGSSGG